MLLTVLLLMVIVTVIGLGAVTITGMENRLAGYGRTGEAGIAAAESCLGTAVKIIQQTIDAGMLAAEFVDTATPAGPVPSASATTLQREILGQWDNNPDTPESSPNTVANIGGFAVRGDIDRLYVTAKAGGSLQFASGYEGTAGGASSGGVDIMYRVECAATNAATSTSSRISAVYACTMTDQSCQRKI